MSQALTFYPTFFHSGVELVYSPEWTKIFRTKAFTIVSEVFTLLIIVAAAGIWIFAA